MFFYPPLVVMIFSISSISPYLTIGYIDAMLRSWWPQKIDMELIMMEMETLKTVKQVANSSSAFTENSLRWLIFCRETNGLSRALVKVGSRVLIDVPEFELWLEEKRVGGPLRDADSGRAA